MSDVLSKLKFGVCDGSKLSINPYDSSCTSIHVKKNNVKKIIVLNILQTS
jgi:hypothetical protein